ncbi:creatininase family protein [Haloarchaeobius sp. HME9146]|uniref:creatininase family protein n=1 Tax=Haloarchaeobius sp. HME9146 TaxID=2978732 RepID=UPI0021BF1A71|nr:creatininase family protein [Haloarchaeobius sp. HME9146]MCT9096314.1 creatininase family protein [Haloarchaeobius sp. HME9146]
MYLADQTWPDLGDYVAEESVAIVPLGSTEQHGPHLPLSTDHKIAEALAREAADRTGFLCTPTVDIGVSTHHMQFHGTMSVDPPAFRDYVESFSRNLTRHGIDRIVYVNAHGGNMQHLREVGRRLREDRAAYAVEWMWDESIPDLIDEFFPNKGPHGGPKETSMLLHIDPENVKTDKLEAARDGGRVNLEDGNPTIHGARNYYDAIDNSPNGVFGDQTEASAEKGAKLLDAASEQLAFLLEWLDDKPFDDLMAKPHVDPQPGSRRE